MTRLALGTSSWSFPDWRGTFYPEGLSAGKQLAFYTTQFNSVEVNTTFYALPSDSTVNGWLNAAPAEFQFACKAPRLITHEKRLVAAEAETLAYLDLLRSLGTAAAPGLVQLPPTFTRERDGRTLALYLDWLSGVVDGIELAIEVRAPDLMTQAFAQFLGERGFGMVVVERVGTPDLFESWLETLGSLDGEPYLFLRMIGDDRNKLPHDRTLQRPQDERLDRWAERIADLLDQNVAVYAYIHNPLEGHSPASVRRLWQRINERHPLPSWAPPPLPPDSDPDQLALF